MKQTRSLSATSPPPLSVSTPSIFSCLPPSRTFSAPFSTSSSSSSSSSSNVAHNSGRFIYHSIIAIALAVFCALAIKLFFLDLFSVVEIDRCNFDRFVSIIHYPYLNSLIAHLSFYSTVAAIFALLAFFIYQSLHTYTSFTRVFALVSIPIWYFTVYSFMFALRDMLGDFACSSQRHPHANSISGHFAFHHFYILTLAYLPGFLSKFGEESPLTPLTLADVTTPLASIFGYAAPNSSDSYQGARMGYVVAYIVLIVSSVVTLARTWIGGYHSIRQILYGIVVGIAAHLILNVAFRYTFNRRQVDPFFARVKMLIGLVASFALVNLIFHFEHIFGSAHALYTAGEIAFLVVGFGALVALLFISREEDALAGLKRE